MPFAWLSLDDADNDPVRFWTYVVSSLRHAGSIPPDRSTRPSPRPARTAREAGLPELVNALAGVGPGVVLVLDDYHLISEPAIHGGVAFLLERSPPGRAPRDRRRGPPRRSASRGCGPAASSARSPTDALRFDRAGPSGSCSTTASA